jgi:hypothetical protein
MTNLVDVQDGDEVNDAYAIETQYNDNTDTYIVEARTTTTETELLPVHPNDGVWTNDEVTSYINDVLGLTQGGPVPPIEDFLDPDKCSVGNTPLPSFKVYFAGGYERYDVSEDKFADSSPRLFLIDLLAGPNGDLDIEVDPGYDDYGIEWTAPLKETETSSSGDLRIDQRSFRGDKTIDTGYDGICSEPNDRQPTLVLVWGTETEDLRYRGSSSVFEKTFKGTGATRTVSGYMKVKNYYYDKNGSRWDTGSIQYSNADGLSLSRTENHTNGKTRGLCGYSRTEFTDNVLVTHSVKATTAVGNYPKPCPRNNVTF